jgi:3-oxoacyl-[acyl-carrier protein] reductase
MHASASTASRPGLVDTKMTKVTTSNPKRLSGAIEQIPLKRL